MFNAIDVHISPVEFGLLLLRLSDVSKRFVDMLFIVIRPQSYRNLNEIILNVSSKSNNGFCITLT